SVSLTPENVILDNDAKLVGDYIFIGQRTLSEPQIGDIRISFKAVSTGIPVTLFGKLEGGKVVPYYKDGHRLYRVLFGSRDEAIAKMATEHKTLTWILRGLGFLMMWMGLCLIFEPLNTLLDIIPPMGSISRGLIIIVLFGVALVLSLITIIISIIAHNILLLFLVLFGVGTGFFWWFKAKKKRGMSAQI
ncbi:hypothetical protein H5T58_03570, partial [Candidatus Parcubacteria bacterium]|nr:hypothetical protein [Candidatus Parcubacteria bacterium]